MNIFCRPWLLLAFIVCCVAPGTPSVQATPTPDDTYDAPEAWLCRPGRQDACSGEQAVTRIAADGSRTVQVLRPQPDAPIDCFYVYPTISTDPHPNSTLTPGEGELRATAHQFAPFASVCRPYAPMYRQVTLAGLRLAMTGHITEVDLERPFEDVRAAWRHYLAQDNHGRGVVLIGHSQGSRMLIELLKRDIDGQPAQKQLVSALVIGTNVMVPAGQASGGTLPTLATCRSGTDTGCIVAYSTFRADMPPPDNARFGRSPTPTQEVTCADPVALSGQPLQSLLVREVNLLGQPAVADSWAQALQGVTTPFVDLPDYLQARCVQDGLRHYLALTLDPTARGQRPADIPGDIVYRGHRADDWGLHLVDINVVLGNLLALVRQQGENWRAR